MRLTFKDDNGKEITISQTPISGLHCDTVEAVASAIQTILMAANLDYDIEVRRK